MRGDVTNVGELPKLVILSSVLFGGTLGIFPGAAMDILRATMAADTRVSIYDLHY